MAIKTLHVYDFDGTLVDSSHRYQTKICPDGVERIDLDYWIANEDKTLDDTPLPLADKFREDLNNPSVYVVVATARIWCNLSRYFAELNNLSGQHIIARRDRNDMRGGAQLKINGLRKLLALKQFSKVETIEVYEDNVDYLKTICEAFPRYNVVGHFYPSKQGH